jgi:hypothetical protein
MTAPIIIDKHQLAKLLGCRVTWIEDKCAARKIPHLLLGGRYSFTEQHVADIIAMHERRPEPEQPAISLPAPPAPQRRTRASRAVQPVTRKAAPLRDRGLPVHRLQRSST